MGSSFSETPLFVPVTPDMAEPVDNSKALTHIIHCSFPKCTETFQDARQMKAHKVASKEHEYCKKCDQDFPDYDAHLEHRVVSDKHITCDKCGKDFGSNGGLSRHRVQLHPIEQDIVCKDCGQKFTRASAYVRHIEGNFCKKNIFSARQLEASKQHKHIVREILGKPQDFNFRIQGAPEPTKFEDEEDPESHGGVSLTSALDDNEEQKHVSYAALRPDLGDLIDLKKNEGPLNSPTAASKAPAAAQAEKAMQSNYDWEYALANKDQAQRKENSGNLMHSQNAKIYNPESSSYDPYRFWDTGLQAFRCPYKECEKDTIRKFQSAMEIKEHMITVHMVTGIICPVCFKRFKTSAALVGHCESPASRCKVHLARNFGQLMDEVSGGFLQLKDEEGEYDTPLFEAEKPPDAL